MNKLTPAAQSWLLLLLVIVCAALIATTAVMTAPAPSI
jgi:hypothetical protein